MVNTAVPAQQKTPERKALNGKLPTIREYINCNMAVARAQQANISSTLSRGGTALYFVAKVEMISWSGKPRGLDV